MSACRSGLVVWAGSHKCRFAVFAVVVVSLFTLVYCKLLSAIREAFIVAMSSEFYGRRKRRKERRAQTNAFFRDLTRWEMDHKGTSDVMDIATSQALLSQGTLESEITFKGEAGLHKSFFCCPKFAKHGQFIPATAFTMEHLPIQYQDKDVHDCIKRLITLAVCIRVKYTSKNRPLGYPFSKVAVSDADKHERLGSGSVFLPRKRRKGKFCPCHMGRDSSNPCKRWYHVWVSTAHHVVYDDLEASQTRVGWQFNDDANKDSITWLQGIRLVNSDVDSDRCILECITHDAGIRDSIRRARLFLKQKEKELNERYVQCVSDNSQPFLAVIVSHPHGGAKQVSLGTDVLRRRIKDNCPGVEWTEYLYDAPTCRGSSGALVWLLGQMRVGYRDKTITTHTHSGQYGETFNKSGGGLDLVSHHTTGDCPPSNSAVISPLHTSGECETRTKRFDILYVVSLIVFAAISSILIDLSVVGWSRR